MVQNAITHVWTRLRTGGDGSAAGVAAHVGRAVAWESERRSTPGGLWRLRLWLRVVYKPSVPRGGVGFNPGPVL